MRTSLVVSIAAGASSVRRDDSDAADAPVAGATAHGDRFYLCFDRGNLESRHAGGCAARTP